MTLYRWCWQSEFLYQRVYTSALRGCSRTTNLLWPCRLYSGNCYRINLQCMRRSTIRLSRVHCGSIAKVNVRLFTPYQSFINYCGKKQPHLPAAASIKELKCRKTRVAFYREHATAKETAARRLPQSTPPTNQDNGDCCHLFVGRSSLNTAGSICTKWSSHGELSDEELQATGDFRVNQLWPAVVWEATRATRGTKCNHNCSWHDFKKADYWRVVCTVNRSTISSSAVAGVP